MLEWNIADRSFTSVLWHGHGAGFATRLELITNWGMPLYRLDVQAGADQRIYSEYLHDFNSTRLSVEKNLGGHLVPNNFLPYFYFIECIASLSSDQLIELYSSQR